MVAMVTGVFVVVVAECGGVGGVPVQEGAGWGRSQAAQAAPHAGVYCQGTAYPAALQCMYIQHYFSSHFL